MSKFSNLSKGTLAWLIVGLVLMIVGHYWGLVIAPAEREMGDVYRIIFVHVPSAWMALLAYTVTLGASLCYLVKGSYRADVLAAASAEVGVFFNILCLITGSIWGKPTWGVYWSWDPRLTTAAIMCIAYAGYLALRRFIDEPERRATWGAVTAIIVYADIPIVWFSVKWWNSLHQLQSNTSTMSPEMYQPMRISAFAFLFVMIALIQLRSTAIRRELDDELNPPLEPSLGGAQ